MRIYMQEKVKNENKTLRNIINSIIPISNNR